MYKAGLEYQARYSFASISAKPLYSEDPSLLAWKLWFDSKKQRGKSSAAGESLTKNIVNIRRYFIKFVPMFLWGLTFIALSFVLTEAGIATPKCDSRNKETIPKIEVLGYANAKDEPIIIDISHKTGNIYFLNQFDRYFYVLKRGENETNRIDIDGYARTLAVDHVSGYVYIGCTNGVTMYNEITGYLTPTGITKEIDGLFVSKNGTIFMTVAWTGEAYSYSRGTSTGVPINISFQGLYLYKLIIDNESNYFFQYKDANMLTITTAVLNGSSERINYGEAIKTILVDNEGLVYGLANDGVYRLYPDDRVAQLSYKLVNHIPRTMCFDENNNIIYVKDGEIVLLEYYNCKCSSLSHKNDILSAKLNGLSKEQKNMTSLFESFVFTINRIEEANEKLENQVVSLEQNNIRLVEIQNSQNEAIDRLQYNITASTGDVILKNNENERRLKAITELEKENSELRRKVNSLEQNNVVQSENIAGLMSQNEATRTIQQSVSANISELLLKINNVEKDKEDLQSKFMSLKNVFKNL